MSVLQIHLFNHNLFVLFSMLCYANLDASF